jgi:xanthine dehydrogenase accessory factor
VSQEALDGLRGPVGLDLGGRQPAETALAILAEIVAERYGGTGRPMRDRAASEAATRLALEGTPVTAG